MPHAGLELATPRRVSQALTWASLTQRLNQVILGSEVEHPARGTGAQKGVWPKATKATTPIIDPVIRDPAQPLITIVDLIWKAMKGSGAPS